MADRVKRRKSWKNKNLNILRKEKSFLDVIKIIFHNFLKAIIWEKKNKKKKKQGTQVLSKLIFCIINNEVEIYKEVN